MALNVKKVNENKADELIRKMQHSEQSKNSTIETIKNLEANEEFRKIPDPVTETKEIPLEEEKEPEFVPNPIFDINDPRVIFPSRKKKGSKSKGRNSSIFISDEEFEYLEKVAGNHGLSTSMYIRTLIINSH